MRISISISDPWDIGDAYGWVPFSGEVIKIEENEYGGMALIRLESPIYYRDLSLQFLIAKPRHKGDSIAAVRDGDKVLAAFVGISDEQAASDISADGWRGGLAFIGDLVPL
jgi:hypothetical protein